MIINSIDVFREYLDIENNLSLDRLNPAQNITRPKWINPWFSDSLVTQLVAFESEAAGSSKRMGYDYFMTAYTNFCMVEYIPSGELRIGDAGILRTETDTAKTAYSGQIDRLMTQHENNGWMAMEALINLMYDLPAIFTEWANSPGYANSDLLMIKKPSDFNQIVRLHRSFATFNYLIPTMEDVQEFYLNSWIDSTLLTELLMEPNPSPQLKQLRGYLNRAIANLTVAKALKDNLVSISSDGVHIIERNSDESTIQAKEADSDKLSTAIKHRTNTGELYINRAKKYMISNESTFGTQPEPYVKKSFWM